MPLSYLFSPVIVESHALLKNLSTFDKALGLENLLNLPFVDYL